MADKDHAVVSKNSGNMSQVYSQHVASLTTDTNEYKFPVDFTPDFWVVVSNGTAGDLTVYLGAGKSAISFKLAAGVLKLPFNEVDTLTIATNGFSNWFSVYALKNVDGFDIHR